MENKYSVIVEILKTFSVKSIAEVGTAKGKNLKGISDFVFKTM